MLRSTEMLIKLGRMFYGIAMVVYGIQQLVYADFRNVLFPAWQSKIPLLPVWAIIFGIVLIAAGVAIIFEKTAKKASLLLGGAFLALFCFVHVPYEILDPYSYGWHLGSWANALKELALSGGAFVIAGSFHEQNSNVKKESALLKLLERIVPFGKIFFSFTITSFGIAHFMYVKYLAEMVPAWIPDHTFWVYFAGVALLGSGVFIILNIRRRVIATLLGIMIFLWVILLHIPHAIADPFADRGIEVSSVFDALAFSGTAFLIAFGNRTEKEKID